MEETKILEAALKNCHLLEEMLKESIRTVRKLNVRYNIDWLVHNYNDYINSIRVYYESDLDSSQFNNINNEEDYSMTRRSIACLSPVSTITNDSRRHTLPGSVETAVASTHRNTVNRLYQDKSYFNEMDQNRNKINFRVIKIKRSLETILMQLQRTIDIANRQTKFTHHSYKKGKEFICCH